MHEKVCKKHVKSTENGAPNHLKSMKNAIGIRTGSRADPNSPPGRPGGATAVPRDPCALHGGTDPGSGNPLPPYLLL